MPGGLPSAGAYGFIIRAALYGLAIRRGFTLPAEYKDYKYQIGIMIAAILYLTDVQICYGLLSHIKGSV